MKKILFLLTFIPALLFAQKPEAYQHDSSSPVDDYAKVFTTEQKQQLTDLIKKYFDTVQVSVVTVNTLDGMDIDEFTNRLFRHFGVGDKKTNNGVMILLAVKDRKFRTEVGYGLEGTLTDIFCGQIGREAKATYFKTGKYAEGLYYMADKYINKMTSESKEIKAIAEQNKSIDWNNEINNFITVFLVFAFITLSIVVILVYYRAAQRKKRAKEAEEIKIKSQFKEKSSFIKKALELLNDEDVTKLNIPETNFLIDLIEVNNLDKSDEENFASLQGYINYIKIYDGLYKDINRCYCAIRDHVKQVRDVLRFMQNQGKTSIVNSIKDYDSKRSEIVFTPAERVNIAYNKYKDSVDVYIKACDLSDIIYCGNLEEINRVYNKAKNNYDYMLDCRQTLDSMFNNDRINKEELTVAKRNIEQRIKDIRSYYNKDGVSSIDVDKTENIIKSIPAYVSTGNAVADYKSYSRAMKALSMSLPVIIAYDTYQTKLRNERLEKEKKEQERQRKEMEARRLREEEEERQRRERRRRQEEEEEEERRRNSSYSSYTSSLSSWIDTSSSSTFDFGGGSSGGGGASDDF